MFIKHEYPLQEGRCCCEIRRTSPRRTICYDKRRLNARCKRRQQVVTPQLNKKQHQQMQQVACQPSPMATARSGSKRRIDNPPRRSNTSNDGLPRSCPRGRIVDNAGQFRSKKRSGEVVSRRGRDTDDDTLQEGQSLPNVRWCKGANV